jgi:hypothetical protein
MNTLLKPKLQISLNNLDDITNNTLKFFFKSNLCDKAELKTKDKEIDVFIIDSDRKFDQQIISNLKANNQFAIFLYNQMNNPILEENTYNVTKPVQVKYLKQQIDFITTRINEVNNTETDSIPPTSHKKQKIHNIGQPEFSPKLFQVSDKQKPTLNFQNNHLSNAIKDTTELNTLNQYKAHKHVGSNKDINPDNPEELKKIYHNPKKYLYHHLVKAVKIGDTHNSDVIIKTLFGSLLFDHKSNEILHEFSKAKMRYFKSSPLFLETEIILTSISIKARESNSVTQDSESLIWQAAINASKGRVPLGTSLTQTVDMSTWPNFSRLLVFRYVIQITAAWSTHHMSLLDTASQLHIPQRYIFTLYNAMLAIDSAKINNVINNVRKINNDKRKSIFTKILSHIFNP